MNTLDRKSLIDRLAEERTDRPLLTRNRELAKKEVQL